MLATAVLFYGFFGCFFALLSKGTASRLSAQPDGCLIGSASWTPSTPAKGFAFGFHKELSSLISSRGKLLAYGEP